MGKNKEFLSKIKSDKAKFYLFDFHVHSPASYDVRLGNRFTELSEAEKTLLEQVDKNLFKNPEEYEQEVIKKFPPEKYYNLLVDHRNELVQKENIEKGDDWAFIAITDHNVCLYAEQVSKISLEQKNLKSNRLIVLPGIELEVEFIEPENKQKVSIHTLLIFEGKTSSRNIGNTIYKMSNNGWEYGSTLNIKSLSEFIHKMRTNKEHRAICIAAHVTSSKGIREETKKCIINNNQAEILRCNSELDTIDDEKTKSKLQEKIKQLQKKISDKQEISFEILNLMGKCGFDALQVRDKEDGQYYSHIHRYDKEKGRAVAIACSDAHKINDIFKCNNENLTIPFIKLNNISSSIKTDQLFNEIRDRGLRYGETRVKFIKPGSVTCWIEGIQIYKDVSDASDFWVSENSLDFDNGDKRFILPFSRNLNCIIGGRGSGKSAAIEIIKFLQDNNEFKTEGGKNEKEKADWYNRAKATLKGCKISMCWRILKQKALKKSSLFVEGFFAQNNKYGKLEYTDIDDKNILQSKIKLPKVDFYRIHDIEQTANPKNLRKLFDDICGEEVENLSNNIVQNKIKLKQNRKELIDVVSKIDSLTKENSPLREYARRKKEFDLVNKEDIKEQFDLLDKVEYAQKLNDELLEKWNNLIDDFKLEGKKNQLIKIIRDIKKKLFVNKNQEKKLREYCDNINQFIDSISKNSIKSIIESLEKELKSKKNMIEKNKDKISTNVTQLEERLRKEGIQKGGQDRTIKKKAFEESEHFFEEYKKYISEFEEKCKIREKLYQDFLHNWNLRSKLRGTTANKITYILGKNLDKTVIQIEVNDQVMQDKEEFRDWLINELDWSNSKYRDCKVKVLLEKDNFYPENLKNILMLKEIDRDKLKILSTDKKNASDGKISFDESQKLVNNNKVLSKIEPEVTKEDYGQEYFESLPKEIKQGLYTFNHKSTNKTEYNLDSILMLDEILLDDLPIIKFNDRPNEQNSKKKELDKLSPGQRCSAILPIILLTGNNPIIIDQPEDNLDNRLIRQVIVNILANIKLQRQVIIATHNANLPVLGDAEKVIALRAIDEDKCKIDALGCLDDKEVVKNITEIMEGGREAFQYRQTIYQSYWENGAEH